jgi:hypothetical protein
VKKTIHLGVVAGMLLAICAAKTTYNGLVPILPKPSSKPSNPSPANSLRPLFKWHIGSQGQKVEFAIWEAVVDSTVDAGTAANTSLIGMVRLSAGRGPKSYVKGSLICHKDEIVGGEYQMDKDLTPNAVYYWSVRPVGASEWSTADYSSTVGAPQIGLGTKKKSTGSFFLIKTPKR